jgi:hypothetical protein
MKRIFTLIMIAGVVYLSSCGNGANDKIAVIPAPDSTSKGSKFQISFGSETFFLNDYTLNKIPTVSLFASDIYNATDSMWHARIEVTDRTNKQISLILNVDNPIIGDTSVATFYVTKNTSTLSDYSNGENKTYAISVGSYVNITQATYPIKGDLFLTLYYNHDTLQATGNFLIYY